MATKRTRREFTTSEPIWPRVESWAATAGYDLKQSSDSSRTYQKGKGFWVAPMMLGVGQEGERAHVEAWIRTPPFARAMSLFMLPREMGVESGGVKARIPRNMARRAVNDLLSSLGQPPIP
jgi:hypothetical protein